MIQAFRHSLTTGLFTLPCGYAIAGLLYLLHPDISWQGGWILVVFGIVCFYLYALYNQMLLFRENNSFTPCCMMILYALEPYSQFRWELLAIPVLVICNTILFSTYENKYTERYLFHLFLILGFSIFFLPELLWMGIAFFLFALVYMRAITPKSLVACLLGWFVVASLYGYYCFYTQTQILPHFASLHLPHIHQWTFSHTILTCYTLLLLLCSLLHYNTTKYNDNIRSRMYFYILSFETVLFALGSLFLPEKSTILQILMILTGGPLFTHYFVLAKGFFCDILFLLSIGVIILEALIIR